MSNADDFESDLDDAQGVEFEQESSSPQVGVPPKKGKSFLGGVIKLLIVLGVLGGGGIYAAGLMGIKLPFAVPDVSKMLADGGQTVSTQGSTSTLPADPNGKPPENASATPPLPKEEVPPLDPVSAKSEIPLLPVAIPTPTDPAVAQTPVAPTAGTPTTPAGEDPLAWSPAGKSAVPPTDPNAKPSADVAETKPETNNSASSNPLEDVSIKKTAGSSPLEDITNNPLDASPVAANTPETNNAGKIPLKADSLKEEPLVTGHEGPNVKKEPVADVETAPLLEHKDPLTTAVAVANPSPVAADPATTKKVSDLEKKVADLEAQIASMSAKSVTKADVDSLRASIERIDHDMNSERNDAALQSAKEEVSGYKKGAAPKVVKVKKRAPAEKKTHIAAIPSLKKKSSQYVDHMSVEPVTMPETEDRPAMVSSSRPAVGGWVLKSAKPGMAWVTPSRGGEMKTVSVGDTLTGVGKIVAISRDVSGKWSIVGTRGHISQ